MKNTVIRQAILKWQFILGAVVCAVLAFCVLSVGVISADAATETVEYVDREWKDGQIIETTKRQECIGNTAQIG